MWRRVTRGLVLAVLATLLTSAGFAQNTPIAALDFPDPNVPQSGVVLVKGWALDPKNGLGYCEGSISAAGGKT